jgi:adenosylcobinamide-phosphate synthase
VIDLKYQILIAVLVDLLLGDPRWLPHPVRLMGRVAGTLETVSRRLIRWPRLAGAVTTWSLILASGAAAWTVLFVAKQAHPFLGDVVAIVLIYTTIAAKDLAIHGLKVYRPLSAGDLAEARRQVSMLVGRDTERLDETGVARAAVESIAENVVDGVTAPLFFAALFGPIGAVVYRATNTLDSMFGYKNERYARFGWASARLDDVANYLPARLTGPLVALAALLLGERPIGSLRILLRDGKAHTSPNAGLPEAAFAGALGVQLGGPSFYFGQSEPVEKPTIGEPLQPLEAEHIRRASRLMIATAVLTAIALVGARAVGEHLWQQGGWAV